VGSRLEPASMIVFSSLCTPAPRTAVAGVGGGREFFQCALRFGRPKQLEQFLEVFLPWPLGNPAHLVECERDDLGLDRLMGACVRQGVA